MKKKVGVLLILLSIMFISIGGYLYFTSPKRVMLKAISNQIKFLDSNLFSVEHEKAQYTTTAEVKLNNEVLTSISGDMYADEIASKYYMNYIIKYIDEVNGEVTVSPEIYLENQKLYLKIKEYFEDIFYIDVSGETDDSLISEEEINELYTLLKETLLQEVKESSFTKSDKKIQILENSIHSEKYSLSISNADLYNIIKSLLTKIEKNKKLSVIKQNLFAELTKEDYLKELDENFIKVYGKNTKLFEYDIYLNNDEIIKSELILYSQGSSINIGFGSYEKNSDIYDYELYIKMDDHNILNATAISDNNNYKINVNFADMILDGTIINTGKNNSLNLNLFYSNDKSVPLFTINYEYSEVVENSEYQTSLNFDINIIENKISFISTTRIICDKEVPEFDVSRAKKFDYQSLATGNLDNYSL